MRFCSHQLADEVPAHRVVCRFRKALTASGAWEVLLKHIHHQRTQHEVLVKQGAIVDASVPSTPRHTTGPSSDVLAEEPSILPTQEIQSGMPHESRWVKKGGKLQ
jgi:IS5 family transposase